MAEDKERKRAYNKQYYQLNREKQIDRVKAWRERRGTGAKPEKPLITIKRGIFKLSFD